MGKNEEKVLMLSELSTAKQLGGTRTHRVLIRTHPVAESCYIAVGAVYLENVEHPFLSSMGMPEYATHAAFLICQARWGAISYF